MIGWRTNCKFEDSPKTNISLSLFDEITNHKNREYIYGHTIDFWFWNEFLGNRQTAIGERTACAKKMFIFMDRCWEFLECAQNVWDARHLSHIINLWLVCLFSVHISSHETIKWKCAFLKILKFVFMAWRNIEKIQGKCQFQNFQKCVFSF